jgi:hypothetical protein
MANIINKKCSSCNLNKNISEYSKRKISRDGYRNQCDCCIKKVREEYIQKNKEKLIIKHKKWVLQNPEKVKELYSNFLVNNPNYLKEYQIKNRDKINERNKKRRELDINFKLKENLRNLIKNSIKYNGFRKNSRTIEILGCTNEFFKQYIENQWSSFNNLDINGSVWMNWNNYGNPKDGVIELNKSWDLDHKIPVSSAKTEEDILKLNHYSNYQPLCSYINRVNKRGKLNYK